MNVVLVDKMGSDLSVVNAARVSFAKKHEAFKEPSDTRLIQYLARHGHWTPFGHCTLSFHITAPIFVARQLAKHQVGLIWNEVSRRYVDGKPEYWMPEHWRKRAEDKKQGSSDEYVDWLSGEERTSTRVYHVSKLAVHTYETLIGAGVAPEQARMVLPQSTLTEWYWTGTLYAFSRICNLRCKPDTQLETQTIANEIDENARTEFPVAWDALRKVKIHE